ncbi:MAG: FtsW/RodA/SpoVE family cell cycle protein, partial [Burkholderiaceae bacterium]
MKRIIQYALRAITAFDWPLLALLVLMCLLGLTVMHSAVGGTDWRFADQSRNFLIAFVFMWVAALLPPPVLMRLALPSYIAGIVLLLGVEFLGETSKGATRWLSIGFTRIQPSEMMKIAVPMMLAWYFHRKQGKISVIDFLVATVLLLAPFGLIVKQPDLGTALLVFTAGFCVIYLGGLSFKLLAPVALVAVVGLGTLGYYQTQICQPD